MKVQNNTVEVKGSCNCERKSNCPLDGKHLIPIIIYKAKITSNQLNYKKKSYIGSAETDFTQRFNKNAKSFNFEQYENYTELSKKYWRIKRSHFTPKVTWRIIRNPQYSTAKRKCYLCLNEKFEVAPLKGNKLLNKRLEPLHKCRNQNKFALLPHDRKD